MINRILLWLFPGDPEWLWRRTCCVTLLANEGWSLHRATDAAIINAHGIVTLGILGAYLGASGFDKHSERMNRQAEEGRHD